MSHSPFHHSFRRALYAALLPVLLGSLGCVKAPTTPVAPGGASGGEATAEPLIEQAKAFSARGDYLRTEQYLNVALAQGADAARVLPLLVRACIADQRYRDAAQYLENHLRRHPTDGEARFLLASVHFSLGQTDVAIKELSAVVAAAPRQADAHYALAVLMRDALGDYPGADHHFREYLRLRPQGPHAEEARGSLLATLP